MQSLPPEQLPCVEQTRWFDRDVHPHGSQLGAYLRRSFPAVRDVDDVVQESYLRIWKFRTAHPIQFTKAFLFKIARNVALNLLAHEQASPIDAVADLTALTVKDNRPTAAEAVCTREEILLLADGIEALPTRCREIFFLRRIKNAPQKEIASLLGISEQTVQVQVQRGVKRCQKFLRQHGVE